jgi:flagellar L-ring protein precursor FlgH
MTTWRNQGFLKRKGREHIQSLSELWKIPEIIAIAACFALTGCDMLQPIKSDPAFAATLPHHPPPQVFQPTGAIYQAGYDMILFEDIKARRVGDLLTIKLVERTDASKSAKTTNSRDTSASISNPTLAGAAPAFGLPGFLPLSDTGNNNLDFELSSKHDFAGKGDSSQRNSLTGDITVTVAEVLPNGYLRVRGEKRLTLNQGYEYVQISGIVRPTDITSDNTVLSTKVADATINYKGEGQLADANKMAWLARFFMSVIFPF